MQPPAARRRSSKSSRTRSEIVFLLNRWNPERRKTVRDKIFRTTMTWRIVLLLSESAQVALLTAGGALQKLLGRHISRCINLKFHLVDGFTIRWSAARNKSTMA